MNAKKHRKYTLRKSDKDAFRLQTGDVTEDSSLFSTPIHRGSLARLLGAGGTRDTREDSEAFPYRRSWRRFVVVLTLLILIWLIGFFLP